MAPINSSSASGDDHLLADEAASLDGYFSDAPLEPQPKYPPIDNTYDRCVVITGLPKVPESKVDKLAKALADKGVKAKAPAKKAAARKTAAKTPSRKKPAARSKKT